MALHDDTVCVISRKNANNVLFNAIYECFCAFLHAFKDTNNTL